MFGDVNEIQTPFMRLRDEQRYTHTGEETSTISPKYILEDETLADGYIIE